MFRRSAPAEGRERSRSGKWIRRLTGATKPSTSETKGFVGDSKPVTLKPRSPSVLPTPITRTRPQITIPLNGYLSTRKPSTPKQSSRRPVTPKQASRRPVTPKKTVVSHMGKQTRRKSGRPGSSKSTRSARSKMEIGSLESAMTDGSPAYLSCLDEIFNPLPEPPEPPTQPHPHVLFINDQFAQAVSRAVSPALPSATSWTLEKSLGDLWDWREVHDDPTDRLSKSSSSTSESTLADGEESLQPSPSMAPGPSRKPEVPFIQPLNIVRPTPTLSLPPRGRNHSRTSSGFPVSPTSTVVASPITDPKHNDIWKVISALRDSWEDDEDGVWRWASQTLADDDDVNDGLLSHARLSVREKRLGNYI